MSTLTPTVSPIPQGKTARRKFFSDLYRRVGKHRGLQAEVIRRFNHRNRGKFMQSGVVSRVIQGKATWGAVLDIVQEVLAEKEVEEKSA